MTKKLLTLKTIIKIRDIVFFKQKKMRVCQNAYPLFYDKAPTFPSRGFVIT